MASAAPRRPHGFWEEVNAFFRQVIEDEGRKPTGRDLRLIYNANLHKWFPNERERPDWKAFRIHVKSLKTVAYVRRYFKEYRAERKGKADKSQVPDKRQSRSKSRKSRRLESRRAARRAAGGDDTSQQRDQLMGDAQLQYPGAHPWSAAGGVDYEALLAQVARRQREEQGIDEDDDYDEDEEGSDDDSDEDGEEGDQDQDDEDDVSGDAAGALLKLTTSHPSGVAAWDPSFLAAAAAAAAAQGGLPAGAVMVAAGVVPGSLPQDPSSCRAPQGSDDAAAAGAGGGACGELPGGGGPLPATQEGLLQLIQLQNLQLQQLQLQLHLQVQALYGSGLAPALGMPYMQMPLHMMYGAPAMMTAAAAAGAATEMEGAEDGEAEIYSTSPPV